MAEKAHVTKRTIDHYTNLGLLEAERSPSNYRYYPHTAIERLQLIEKLKAEGMSLTDIKSFLEAKDISDAEEIDVLELRLKIKGLKEDVTEVLAHLDKNNAKESEYVKKQISHESMSLIQTLLLLLN